MIGTREKAYVYGIASAALVHTIARACSIGVTTKCSCGVLPNTAPAGTFKWGGCGDDVHFGAYFCKRFTDASLRTKKGKVKRSTKAMMDEHNFAAGRHVSWGTCCVWVFVVGGGVVVVVAAVWWWWWCWW